METLAHMYMEARVPGESPVSPEEEMHRVVERMRRMSHGQAPGLDGVT